MFKQIHKYLEDSIPNRPQTLREMENYAKEKGFPIVGPLVGRYLYQMAILIKAKNIFELGSGFGYSAIWFSLAARGKGKIIMTDNNKEYKRLALDFFKNAGLESQFDYKVGDALNTLKKFDGPFDIIFNDIDKHDYPQTIDLVAPRLKKGGLFITDNLLWSGKVMDKLPGKNTKAILEFTSELYRDGRFYTTIIPIRDGLAISVKL
ncbi:MAG: O-methyltransferase [bacterium]